ncbi:MAG: FmdB family transcriptional regulator [Actinobacteria bacterium]|nr:FmdB family transcriptional regulator [Actinomycetota bacterium]
MPTYEYACMSCGRHTEAVQRFSDEPLRTCEHCGGPLKRVFHPVGIVLKGSGFYSTDNRGSKSKLATPETKKESESPSAETKSSDAKPSESKSSSESASKKSSSTKGDGGSKS